SRAPGHGRTRARGPCRAAGDVIARTGGRGVRAGPGRCAWGAAAIAADERAGRDHPPARAVRAGAGAAPGVGMRGHGDQEGAMTEPVRWIEVATFGAVYEADMAVETLANAGIPAQVGGGEHVGIFGAGYQG